MSYKDKIFAQLDEQAEAALELTEILFHNDDPDGDEDRAGDGFYYNLQWEENWSGPYDSETIAKEEAEAELKYNAESLKSEIKKIADEKYLHKYTFKVIIEKDNSKHKSIIYMQKDDGYYVGIVAEKDVETAKKKVATELAIPPSQIEIDEFYGDVRDAEIHLGFSFLDLKIFPTKEENSAIHHL